MSEKTVIFISQVFHPDAQATSQLLSELAKELAARGRRVEVLAGYPAEEARRAHCRRREVWQGVVIHRGGFKVNAKRHLLIRALGYASFSLWLGWRLLLRTSADARLLVVTNPPFAPLWVHACARLRGNRYDVILHDIYPDGLIAIGRLNAGSLLSRCWSAWNRRALGGAERVVVLGRDMARLVAETYQVPSAKIAVIPHWSLVSARQAKPVEESALWRRLAWKGKFIIQYSGNMGLWHDLDTIVLAASLLRQEPQVVFLLIGQGRRAEAAKRLGEDLKVPNILWLPFQPVEDLSDSLACCQVALISQRAGLEGVAVPSKLYGILASGRPILAQVPAESEAAMVVREERCGLPVRPGDPSALAQAILRLAKDRDETNAMGANAFSAYQAKYTLKAATDHFEEILGPSGWSSGNALHCNDGSAMIDGV